MKSSLSFQLVRKTVLRFLVLTVFVVPAEAQTLSLGGKAGATLSDPFILNSSTSSSNNYSVNPQRYLFGPTFELGLPLQFVFEADALYKRLEYVSFPFGFNSFQASTTANSWEFPLLLKRSFLSGISRPFGDVGASFRHVGGTTTFSNTAFQATQDPLELTHSWSTGVVAGGGVDFSYGSIHVSPEIRYTRWGTANFNSSNGVLGSNLNSLDLIIGVTFSNGHR
jgi:opacity protein-like surface antigen